MDEKFKKLMADALEIDISEVSVDLSLDPEENWDSVALLSVISEIDNEYKLQLDGEELANCKKVSEILSLINSH